MRRPWEDSGKLGVSYLQAWIRTIGPMIAACDISALAGWAEDGLSSRLEIVERLPEPPEWTISSAALLDPLVLREARLEARPERPLHVLVCSQGRRVRAAALRSHVWSTPLPDAAFYQLTDEVLLASPSFCVRQIAPRSSLARIALVEMELCGRYGRTPNVPGGYLARSPVTTPEELHQDLAGFASYGSGRAVDSLAFVVSGSRSPMETVVYLLFTLPVEFGGCGFPRPALNCPIDIPPHLQIALGRPYLVADMCWRTQMIIFEYDSYEFHSLPRQVDLDHARNEGLRDMGWVVRSITAGMLANDAILREIADKAAARMGIVLPSDERYLLRRHDLVRELLRGP